MKILIVGGGNMGLTFAKAFINSRVVVPKQLTILEKNEGERVEMLNQQNLGQIVTDPSLITSADLVILAVKPQDINSLFDQIAAYVDKEQVFLSIMAGVKIETIMNKLDVNKVIRAMPNLPSQIGLGMTAFTTSETVSRFEQGAVQNLLATTGKTLHVGNEQLIDSVTAVSGSGPAYVFYFIEAMIQAAVKTGIKPAEATLLVIQTFKGSLSLFQQSSFSCQEWINKVASRGGTTEAAIKSFDGSNLNALIGEGIKAALHRAEELGE